MDETYDCPDCGEPHLRLTALDVVAALESAEADVRELRRLVEIGEISLPSAANHVAGIGMSVLAYGTLIARSEGFEAMLLEHMKLRGDFN